MFMDIDKFKIVNDTLGHDIGDELLCQFSQRVKECLRKNDILARFGGNEFCALLLISERENAENIAKRILKALQDKWLIGEYEFFTTSNIGIAFYEDGLDDDTLIKNADIALYKAKEKGRNNYQIFDIL
ncbi:diguanylate cyclase (GGDEF)-like protein [Clostridium beijerinckii]|nr:cyclic di-GMP phosphodiesterase Gmr [Clostridium beijerinckii]MBC2415487.1 GGDEF domain-containing protein [Clostridium beijerinckii]MBC2421772.1 GGDEF domain-containing protein [Clostridium beijerinckii]MBC2432967.1 GGDEF domain-containing protein [Clostridium beijerinckii]MBC2487917.1 GGDEF domain-containing protein [Clostridium beijerinckii]